MKNGEGTEEGVPSEVTPPSAYDPLEDELLPWEDQKSDDEDDDEASEYSSCGDSEFDRYCSANSVMGTPSICDSVYEFPDSDFGSFKSFKLGGESRNLKNFGVEKRLSGFNERHSSSTRSGDGNMRNDEKIGVLSVGTSKGFDLYGDSETFLNVNKVGSLKNDNLDEGWREKGEVERRIDGSCHGSDNIEGNLDIGGDEGHIVGLGITHGSFECMGYGEDSMEVEGKLEEDSESHGAGRVVDGCLEGLHLPSGLDCRGEDLESDCHREDVGRCLDEDEYSEGDDSIYGYGSDDEKKLDSYIFPKVQYSSGEGHRKDANKLLMTSAVAFGSDDWDDFVQETGGSASSRPFEDEVYVGRKNAAENEIGCLDFTSAAHPDMGFEEHQGEVVQFPRTKVQVEDSSEPTQSMDPASSEPFSISESNAVEQGEHMNLSLTAADQVSGISGVLDYPETADIWKHEVDQDPLKDGISMGKGLNMGKTEVENVHLCTSVGAVTGVASNLNQQRLELEKMVLSSNNLSGPDSEVKKSYSVSEESTEDRTAEFVKEDESSSTSVLAYDSTKITIQNSPVIFDHFEDHLSSIKKEKFATNGFYDEMVHEMEEILLDTEKLPLSRFIQSNGAYESQIPLPSRDGGSTASTSGTDDACYPQIQLPVRIDRVEVIGARQKKGDVSLSERLVGVKEYTVYKIRVWSGEDKWEVERRYRDFCSLCRQLKKVFSEQGWILPPSWNSVERESRKIFGNASPDVIAERSVLIQDCLQSILQSQLSSSSVSALISFLSPSKAFPSSSTSSIPITRSPYSTTGADTDHVSRLGKTVSLVVQIRPAKPIKQMLDAQNHSCAGCHKNFDDGRTRMKEIVRTLGWGKPRLCEYSGQLFCSTCHTNDTAVLPARVLHLWEFTQYPVSQIAKSYLDSIYDKPMLCVSAVNPFLFSKVPALQHVTNVRKKIGVMIPYVRCPFRRSIYKALGTRRYLLESNDFFALRDLIDLSKGMFAVLPVMVETVSSKILQHITEQCLICCDSGIPCNARQACNDSSSLIFPFQEAEIERCRSCDSVFHRPCFSKTVTCPCGTRLHQGAAMGSTSKLRPGIGSEEAELRSNGRDADTRASAGFLSGFFSKVMPQRSLLGYKEQDLKEADSTVILMGSLPPTLSEEPSSSL